MTPTTIKTIPIMAAVSGICLNKNIPISVMATIPTPDQISMQECAPDLIVI